MSATTGLLAQVVAPRAGRTLSEVFRTVVRLPVRLHLVKRALIPVPTL